jgi:hypothetical protein
VNKATVRMQGLKPQDSVTVRKKKDRFTSIVGRSRGGDMERIAPFTPLDVTIWSLKFIRIMLSHV